MTATKMVPNLFKFDSLIFIKLLVTHGHACTQVLFHEEMYRKMYMSRSNLAIVCPKVKSTSFIQIRTSLKDII